MATQRLAPKPSSQSRSVGQLSHEHVVQATVVHIAVSDEILSSLVNNEIIVAWVYIKFKLALSPYF